MAMVWAGSQVTKIVRAAGKRSNGRKGFMQLTPRDLCKGLLSLDIKNNGALYMVNREVELMALALAPFVDRGLSWFTVKFEFKSKGKAFVAIAGMCFGLALLLFFGLTLSWA